MVMAGLLGKAEDWLAFTDDWKEVLDRQPRVRVFKSSHLTGQSPESAWHKMSEDERRGRLIALAGVVGGHGFRAVRASVDTRAFQTALAPMLTDPLNQPYFFLFYNILWRIAAGLYDEGERQRIEVVFDEQAHMQPRVKTWYPAMWKVLCLAARTHPRAAQIASILPMAPIFRTDDDLLPLQAADLMAAAHRGAMSEGFSLEWLGTQLPPLRWSIDLDAHQLGIMVHGALGRPRADQVDSTAYALALGLAAPESAQPRYMRARAAAFRASRARISPATPQALGPGPPEEPG